MILLNESKNIEDKKENRLIHLAIIPDGNRRWARKNRISKEEGYSIGIKKIGDVLKWCKEKDIEILTMWGFSLENFDRNQNELMKLFELFKQNLIKIITNNKEKPDINVRFIGKLDKFPKILQDKMRDAEKLFGKNEKKQLNLLMAYGGRQEIIDTINKLLKKGVKQIDEKMFSDELYTHDIPDPDLIIRTSGEMRLSGLMPWQSTYSELYFCKKLWPDFTKEDFDNILSDYYNRKRRYGK